MSASNRRRDASGHRGCGAFERAEQLGQISCILDGLGRGVRAANDRLEELESSEAVARVMGRGQEVNQTNGCKRDGIYAVLDTEVDKEAVGHLVALALVRGV